MNSEQFIKVLRILIRKSLLTSLYQREGMSPLERDAGVCIPSLAKRGKGRFSDKYLFYFENNNNFSLLTFHLEWPWR
ncbi:MAG: hypothetical protein FJ240_01530 [Nitrospira sp.]|nr:hypothetical protein [Nitrospira sp.]